MPLQNNPWLVKYNEIRAMSFLPRVEHAEFKLKKAFQYATSNLKLIKMMLKCQVE